MSVIRRCDICNEVIESPEIAPDLKSFALWQYGDTTDICNDCFRELIEIVKERRNVDKKTCGLCEYFEVDSNFSTDFCLRHKESKNSYDEICDDFHESKEFKINNGCTNCKRDECIDRYKEVSQYCEGEKKDYRTPEEWEEFTIKGLERVYADMKGKE